MFYGTHSLSRFVRLANNPSGKEVIAFEDRNLSKHKKIFSGIDTMFVCLFVFYYRTVV